MRNLTFLLFIGLIAGCGSKQDASDSDASATTASPYAAYEGDWMLEAYAPDGTDPLVAVLLKATDHADGWSAKFTHLEEAVPYNTVTMRGDTIVLTSVPYLSALREGQTVSTTTYLKVDGDNMSGRFEAMYEGNPEMGHGTIKGEKVN